jgi:REP element-mobilizing transposase RayT
VPRKQRDAFPGIHHVVMGATGPSPYFRDDIDRLTWVRFLLMTLARYDWTCVALCQMTTHVHALFDISDESLSIGMHTLNSAYGKRFNARHDRRGTLLRNRYWSTRMKDEAQLLAAFRYAVRNPVRAGICERPEDWFWSSFATSCGLAQTFPFVDASSVLSTLHASHVTPGQALLALVRD